MAIHKPYDRLLPTIGGAVMKEGRSLDLTKGVFGIFNVQNVTKDGSKAISSFKGISKDAKLELRLGKSNSPVTRASNNKSWKSFPFSLKDVVSVDVSAPKSTEQKVDEVIVGYNGMDDATSFKFDLGQTEEFVLRLTGAPLGLYGIPDNEINIPFLMSADGCSVLGNPCKKCDPCVGADCGKITVNTVQHLREVPVYGNHRLTDFVDVTPVLKCTETSKKEEVDYKFYCLEVCDTGDDKALAEVQAQVGKKAVVVSRKGALTKYQVAQPSSDGVPNTFKTKFSDLLKGCEDCPEGYTDVKGGLVYAVTLEDDGADHSSKVEELANAVSGTAVKSDGQDAGLGMYSVVLDKKLSDKDFDKFIESNPTSTISFIGKSSDWCKAGKGAEISWKECGTCKMSKAKFEITLADNGCGKSRLLELKSFYPDLEIKEIEGSAKACQRKYETTVLTNVVCDECDDVFKDLYTAKSPESFEGVEWKGETQEVGTGCLCGIRFKSKVFEIQADGCLEDRLGFMDSSVRIEVSGGFDREHLMGINDFQPMDVAVTWFSKAEPRTHLGGNLKTWENESRVFFSGESYSTDYMEKSLLGEESHLESGKQYAMYAITLNRPIMSQGFAGHTVDTITYHVSAELGKHSDLENLVNALAAGAGKEPVKA